ncbi:WLM domain-containing protein [Mycena olivaceomarginata]|nr:WLM domain-containing protein [Mycena olivaceomarginata]
MSTDSFVRSFTRVASLVKPIMRKHGLGAPSSGRIFSLRKTASLILLRLRPAHAPDTFFEEDEVIQTMLHELTHNVHGPHDEKFYKFLSGLQEEYDALQRSGYAGEGFFSKGQRVGTGVSHDLPPHLARRLGGRIDATNLTPRELAARAAERRARDEKACGSGDLAQLEADKAANESITHDAIDLTLDSDDDSEDSDVIVVYAPPTAPGPSKLAIPQSKKAAASTAARPTPAAIPAASIAGTHKPKGARARPAANPPPAKKSRSEWTCRTCTLINSAIALQCDACLAERPPDESIGWACYTCGQAGIPHDFWTCTSCGTVKLTS